MQQVTIEEAKKNLAELFDCALSGEEIILTKNGDGPVVRLEPFQKAKRRQAGSAAGMFTISDDFDEPLEEFKEYME